MTCMLGFFRGCGGPFKKNQTDWNRRAWSRSYICFTLITRWSRLLDLIRSAPCAFTKKIRHHSVHACTVTDINDTRLHYTIHQFWYPPIFDMIESITSMLPKPMYIKMQAFEKYWVLNSWKWRFFNFWNRNGQKKEFPDDFPLTSDFLIMIELTS